MQTMDEWAQEIKSHRTDRRDLFQFGIDQLLPGRERPSRMAQ